MINKKQIVLCADDYGLNDAISQGICQLVANHRLSAVSVMTNMPNVIMHAQALKLLNKDIAIGLHFNLTEGRLLTNPAKKASSLIHWILKSHLTYLSQSMLSNEFYAQLTTFKEAYGRLPDFIDGHQHIHQFPQIRRMILKAYQQVWPKANAYVRATTPTLSDRKNRTKALLLAFLGGQQLSLQLKQAHIPHNPYFAGLNTFNASASYALYFQRLLANIKNDTLIMCHPGLLSNDLTDPIRACRVKEWQYFNSDNFLNDCEHYKVLLATGKIT